MLVFYKQSRPLHFVCIHQPSLCNQMNHEHGAATFKQERDYEVNGKAVI